jgi:hypothetical protein
MVEGEDAELVEKLANRIVDSVKAVKS